MRIRTDLTLATLIGLLPLALAPASAETFTDISSPTLSPFSYSGGGTSANPFILNETVNDPLGEFYVGVDGFSGHPNGGSPSGAYFTKVITNNSSAVWQNFEVEVGTGLGFGSASSTFVPSPDGDGLSLAQGQSGRVTNPVASGIGLVGGNGTFNSDVFNSVFVDETNTRDFSQFFGGGSVLPGGTLTINFRVTDNASNTRFLIREKANVQLAAGTPEPSGVALIIGISGFAFARLRRKR